MKKEISGILHFHNNLETLFPYVPFDTLPKHYSGSEVEMQQLHERSCRMIFSKNNEIIENQKLFRINENLRPDILNNVS